MYQTLILVVALSLNSATFLSHLQSLWSDANILNKWEIPSSVFEP